MGARRAVPLSLFSVYVLTVSETSTSAVPSRPIDRKSTRLNSSHANISSLSLHDALPICRGHGHRARCRRPGDRVHAERPGPGAGALAAGLRGVCDGGTARRAPIALFGVCIDRVRNLHLCRPVSPYRSEEHTSELQSRQYLQSFPTRRSSDLSRPWTSRTVPASR